MRSRALIALALPTLLAAAGASAQPRIISFGNGSTPFGVNANGTIATASGSPDALKFNIGATSVTSTPLTGATGGPRMSDDGLFFVTETPNEGALGGLSATATITSLWSDAAMSPSWVDLPLLTADATLGVTGSGVSSGSIHGARDVSATGLYVVGQAYVAPNNSFRFRPYIWDSISGASRVLETEFNIALNRYRDGRALGVSADGGVIVGAQDANTSSGKALVWRWNAGTMQYDMTILDRGTDPTTMQPYTSSVDNFYINAAGTKIVGTSFEFNMTTMFADTWLTRWDWNAGANSWDRVLLYNTGSQQTISSWQNDPLCSIPPQFITTGMSDDGSRITGILVYSTCGSFIRGGFLWIDDGMGGTMHDLYDYLVAQGTPGITDFGPLDPMATVFNPPRLGWANAMSSDGQNLVGYGGPQTPGGPGWVVNLNGGGCVPPFFTAQPANDTFSNCNSLSINVSAGGSAPLTYQWFKDGAPLTNGGTVHGSTISGANDRLLSIAGAKPDDAGMYHCEVTGACGTPAVSNAASVTVDPAVTIPSNDTCSSAMAVGEGANMLAPAQSPCGAFVDDGIIASCEQSTKDLWYVWTPTMTAAYRLETCSATYDTVLSLYSDCSGGELACNDDHDVGPSSGCSSTRSRIASFNATAGIPVYVRVGAFGTGQLFGTPTVNLSIFPAPTAPANDDCSGATPAIVGANPFDTTEATNDWFGSCSSVLGRDVWFVFSAPGNGDVTFTTCGGAAWNTVLSVHDGCFGNELACNDNHNVSPCFSQSTVANLPVTGGSNTYVRLTGNSLTAFGTGTLTVSFTPAPCPGDYNDDGNIDLADLIGFNTDWQPNIGQSVPAGTMGDYNGDGMVDLADLIAFNTDWQPSIGMSCP